MTGNENAFSVTGQEYLYTQGPDDNGPLIDTEYEVDTVERYPIPRVWEDGFDGEVEELEIIDNQLRLKQGGQIATKFYAIADTYAAQNSPNTNYGSGTTFKVLGYSGSYARGYLKFDLSELHDVTIDSAELFVFYLSNDISDREQRHYIKKITGVWAEDTLTYNNAPSFLGEGDLAAHAYGRLQNIAGHGTGVNKWRSADITDLVSEWISGESENYGLVLDHNYNISYDGGIWASILYSSKEGAIEYKPYIEIKHTIAGTSSGAYISNKINIDSNLRIKWNADIPTDTDIKVEVSSNKQNWQEVDNGDIINADGIWIKATLTTDDETVTPILKGLWLEEPSAPQNVILLTMKGHNEFNSAVGKLTVAYNALIGNLTGKGGPVESFEREFSPAELVATPNPGVTELVSVAPVAITAELIPVEFLDAFAKETITVAPVSVTGTLIPIEDLNP